MSSAREILNIAKPTRELRKLEEVQPIENSLISDFKSKIYRYTYDELMRDWVNNRNLHVAINKFSVDESVTLSCFVYRSAPNDFFEPFVRKIKDIRVIDEMIKIVSKGRDAIHDPKLQTLINKRKLMLELTSKQKELMNYFKSQSYQFIYETGNGKRKAEVSVEQTSRKKQRTAEQSLNTVITPLSLDRTKNVCSSAFLLGIEKFSNDDVMDLEEDVLLDPFKSMHEVDEQTVSITNSVTEIEPYTGDQDRESKSIFDQIQVDVYEPIFTPQQVAHSQSKMSSAYLLFYKDSTIQNDNPHVHPNLTSHL